MSGVLSLREYKSQWGTDCWCVQYTNTRDGVIASTHMVSEGFGKVPEHVARMVNAFNTHSILLAALEAVERYGYPGTTDDGTDVSYIVKSAIAKAKGQ